ncbi:MAG: DUF421 domain-containing protein [Peptococcaceae bacterium]|nr:DUF421 domain-containing protein [Peptococcaceae bacterium]
MAGAWMIFLQTVLSFIVLLILTRILGKQQVSQLTFYEYLNGITFGSIAANMATIEPERVPDHLIGMITYGFLTLAVSWLAVKNRKFRKAVAGEPVIVIQDGSILESNMRKMHLDLDELTTMLRSQGIFDYKELELAIVEQSGELSVLKKPEYQEVTQGDLNLHGTSTGLAVEVIIDGQIIYENLRAMGLDGKWLMKQLKEKQIFRISQVCFATVNKQHDLQYDLYADDIPGMIDISEEDTPELSLDGIQLKPKDEPSSQIP